MEIGRIARLADRLTNVERIFLDTAPVIYLVEKNESYFSYVEAVFNRIDEGSLTGVTSPITLAECLIHPYRLGLMQLQQDFIDLIANGSNTVFIPIDQEIARKAAQFRASQNVTLTDALQISTALIARCDAFLTNDATIKPIENLDIIILSDI